MSLLNLSLGCGLYDRTFGLQTGAVTAVGIDINFIPLRPTELFRRQARHREFDVAEFSFSTYCIMRSRGVAGMTAIPVFPSRKFRHSHIFVRRDAALSSPSDLVGKRVGCPEFQNTATTWIRGIISSEYGVDLDSIEWFIGGLNAPKYVGDRIPLEFSDSLTVTRISNDENLNRMLVDGEIDALISANVPDAFVDGSGDVVRLVQDYEEVERDYNTRTGIFPIMHTVVIRDDIYEANRWVARNLCDAFESAKRYGIENFEYPAALFATLPWLDLHLEGRNQLPGGADMFPYGIEANRHVIETFLGYAWDQGLLERQLDIGELFAVETI